MPSFFNVRKDIESAKFTVEGNIPKAYTQPRALNKNETIEFNLQNRVYSETIFV